jgi:hypothetical protein
VQAVPKKEGQRQQEEDKRKQEDALNQLAEMGFTDRNGNKKLLEQSPNDVATVVDLLSQEASTDQRREFGEIAARFRETLPQATLVRIDRVQNGLLYESFLL